MRYRSSALFLTATTLTLGLLVGAGPASAAIVTYTDRTAFQNALDSSFENDFQSLLAGPLGSPQSFSGNGFSYEIAAAGNLFVVNISGDRSVATNVNFAPLVVQNLGGGVTAFGAYFFFNAGAAVDTTTTGSVTATNGVDPSATVAIAAPTSQTGFVGFISTSGDLTSVSFSNTGGNGFGNIDDAIAGSARRRTSVPEPGTFALLALALGGVSTLRRTR